jgi:phosphoglycolate phosphatase
MIKPLDVDAVLFDLDGTLADTAPDLIEALNRLREELGLPVVPEAQIRPFVSKGGAAMLRAGFPDLPDAPTALLDRFLGFYHERICELTELFPGMAEVLLRIERSGRRWGIVTNKPSFLTKPLLEKMMLDRRAAVVVCGDTLPTRKPDPAPVHYALRALHAEPGRAVLVGDDQRDVDAAKAAGVTAVLAGWGYFSGHESPDEWGADRVVRQPLDLLPLLRIPYP